MQPTVADLRGWANRIGGGATRMVTGEAFPKHAAGGFVDRPITPIVEAGDCQLRRVRQELLALEKTGIHAAGVTDAIGHLNDALTEARLGKVGGAAGLPNRYLPARTVREIGHNALLSIQSLAEAARAVSDAASGAAMLR